MNIIQTNLKYKNPLTPLNPKNVLYLVVHHAAAVTASPEDIHVWHLANGWSGFGYNEYIRKDGTVCIGRGDNVGAQCLNMNEKSYGICCEGNYDVETVMPQVQFDALVMRLKANLVKYHNVGEVVPHKRFGGTECPGKYFPIDRVIQSAHDNSSPLSIDLDTINLHIPLTKDYWLANAHTGGMCRGDFCEGLLHKIAEYFRK